MHVDVSMYFATTFAVRSPLRLPRTEAEERRISRFCVLISLLLSRFLELDEERFELRRPRIRIHGGWSQEVGEGTRVVFLTRESPVNRKPDLPGFLSIDLERVQPLGDHGGALDRSSSGRNFHLGAVRDPFLLGESLGDLDKESRLKLIEDPIGLVLRPIVKVFSQAICRTDDREVLLLPVDVLVGGEFLAGRV